MIYEDIYTDSGTEMAQLRLEEVGIRPQFMVDGDFNTNTTLPITAGQPVTVEVNLPRDVWTRFYVNIKAGTNTRCNPSNILMFVKEKEENNTSVCYQYKEFQQLYYTLCNFACWCMETCAKIQVVLKNEPITIYDIVFLKT